MERINVFLGRFGFQGVRGVSEPQVLIGGGMERIKQLFRKRLAKTRDKSLKTFHKSFIKTRDKSLNLCRQSFTKTRDKSLKQKGQAAVTDALFFLVIVMALVSFMFVFSSQYGRTVGEYSSSKYGSDYAVSALKTVLYSSFSRNDFPIDSAEAETDFLIAAIKEDYAFNENIDYFREDLTASVESVIKPVRNSFDYLFFIRIDNTSTFTFPYFFVSRKEFISEFDEKGIFIESVKVEEKNYFCNSSNSVTQNDIDRFIIFVGAKGQAVSSISFPLLSGSTHEGIIQLVLWTPKDFNESEPSFQKLKCILN